MYRLFHSPTALCILVALCPVDAVNEIVSDGRNVPLFWTSRVLAVENATRAHSALRVLHLQKKQYRRMEGVILLQAQGRRRSLVRCSAPPSESVVDYDVEPTLTGDLLRARPRLSDRVNLLLPGRHGRPIVAVVREEYSQAAFASRLVLSASCKEVRGELRPETFIGTCRGATVSGRRASAVEGENCVNSLTPLMHPELAIRYARSELALTVP